MPGTSRTKVFTPATAALHVTPLTIATARVHMNPSSKYPLLDNKHSPSTLVIEAPRGALAASSLY